MKLRIGILAAGAIAAMTLLSACLPSGQAWIRTTGSQRDTFGGSTVTCEGQPATADGLGKWAGKDGHGHPARVTLGIRIEGDLQGVSLEVHGRRYASVLSHDPIVRYNAETKDFSTDGKVRLTDVDDPSKVVDLEAILACPD